MVAPTERLRLPLRYRLQQAWYYWSVQLVIWFAPFFRGIILAVEFSIVLTFMLYAISANQPVIAIGFAGALTLMLSRS